MGTFLNSHLLTTSSGVWLLQTQLCPVLAKATRFACTSENQADLKYHEVEGDVSDLWVCVPLKYQLWVGRAVGI